MKAIAGRCAGMALSLLPFAAPSFALVSPQELIALYAERVDSRLAALQDEQKRFAEAQVQAILLFWRPSAGEAILVGASPASRGRPSGFEHFETPLGVFDFDWVQGQRAWRKKREARCVCRCTPPTHATSSRASAHASRRLHLHSGGARRVPRLLRHSRCPLRP